MYRVALTGTHGVGKTYIVNELRHWLEQRGHRVAVMPSLTRKLKDLGYPINNEDNSRAWETQIVCGVMRILEEMDRQQGVDVLLADRFILDEYVYACYFYNKNRKDSLLLASLKLLDAFVGEQYGKWSSIYYKAPHPDFQPELDGHRDGDLAFQQDIQAIFEGTLENLSLPYDSLALDRDEAVEQIKGDLAKAGF